TPSRTTGCIYFAVYYRDSHRNVFAVQSQRYLCVNDESHFAASGVADGFAIFADIRVRNRTRVCTSSTYRNAIRWWRRFDRRGLGGGFYPCSNFLYLAAPVGAKSLMTVV